jgi:hypothetical protein
MMNTRVSGFKILAWRQTRNQNRNRTVNENTMALTLRILTSPQSTLTALSDAFRFCSSVELVKADKILYLHPPAGLDILYLPLAATERWGAKPLIHKSQILKTSVLEQQQGLPPYIATGTCLSEDDPRGPIPETSLLVSAVFKAIGEFNNENGNRIRIVGFWAVDLLRMVNPNELRMILKDVVPELGLT